MNFQSNIKKACIPQVLLFWLIQILQLQVLGVDPFKLKMILIITSVNTTIQTKSANCFIIFYKTQNIQ